VWMLASGQFYTSIRTVFPVPQPFFMISTFPAFSRRSKSVLLDEPEGRGNSAVDPSDSELYGGPSSASTCIKSSGGKSRACTN